MKKITVLLLALILLVGCGQKTDDDSKSDEKYNSYLSYYQSILDYNDKLTSSSNFDISLAVNKVGDGQYRYDTVINNPKVGMFEIEALMIIEDVTSTINTSQMMPSIGIFEDEKVSMIPGQVDVSKGFVEGIDLSVVSDQPAIHVGVVVSFKDKNSTKITREYFSLSATYEETETQTEGNN